MAERRAPDGFAAGVMLALCLTWGLQQVAMKAAAPVIAPVMQVGVRSAIAALLLLAVMAVRRLSVLGPPGSLRPGVLVGLLFAGEFLFVALGLSHTTAARMSVFLYTSPIFTALGLHLLVPGERLDRRQWLGVGFAFVGVAIAFSEGFADAGALPPNAWLGDLFGLTAGLLWGLTTVAIRASALSEAPPSCTLLYQLLAAAAGLLAFSVVTGAHTVGPMTPIAWTSMAFQSVVVTFGSFLVWFWLLRRYLASRLAVFSFLTPVVGIAAGVLLLNDPFALNFAAGAVCIFAGITLVNFSSRSR